MTETPLTLKAFFCDDAAAPIADSCELDAARRAVETACGKLPAPARAGAVKALAGSLDEVFQVGLGDVLQSSWGRLVALQDVLAASRADPSTVVVTPLLDHKVASKHEPHIDIMLGPKQLTRLVFEIALTLQLKGAALEIRDGRILGLKTGECLGEGTFSMGGQTLIKRTTPALALPGRLAFTAPTPQEAAA